MDSFKPIKEKVKNAVEDYKRMFPMEYRATVDWIDDVRNAQKTKFAEVGKENVLDRKLGEMPETLDIMIRNALSPEEREVFFDKKESKILNRWFFNEFREFKITVNI